MKQVMRVIAMMFWAVLLGQVLGFICSSLTETVYQPLTITIVSLIFAVIVYVISLMMQHFNMDKSHSK